MRQAEKVGGTDEMNAKTYHWPGCAARGLEGNLVGRVGVGGGQARDRGLTARRETNARENVACAQCEHVIKIGAAVLVVTDGV